MVLGEQLNVVVGVLLVRAPLGAQAWHYLEYAAGLKRLGHRVTVVEVADEHEWTCYDPTTGELGTDATYGLAYVQRALAPHGLADDWAYHDCHSDGWTGPAAATLADRFRAADLFLNVSGVNAVTHGLETIPRRVFIDTDPGFVQVRNLRKEEMRSHSDAHNAFFTFGELFGRPGCRIPSDGYDWRPTRQPVLLDAWAVTAVPGEGALTTVMKWDSYRVQEHDGLRLAMKSDSVLPFLHLPERCPVPLEMALGGAAPRDGLRSLGWQLVDPQQVAGEPDEFQAYIAGSLGELAIAKHGYVVTRGGWFSERSAHYLASGRTVVTQETGFSDLLPTGSGLLSFENPDQAVAAVQQVAADPAGHGAAAREIAVEHFDSDKVLTRLLDDVYA